MEDILSENIGRIQQYRAYESFKRKNMACLKFSKNIYQKNFNRESSCRNNTASKNTSTGHIEEVNTETNPKEEATQKTTNNCNKSVPTKI